MRMLRGRDSGQTIVEFAIIGTVLMMLTIGLVDVGRGFYQYNAVSSASHFGSRWAAVVGGTCIIPGSSTADWCTQQNSPNFRVGQVSTGATQNFWQQTGNVPL